MKIKFFLIVLVFLNAIGAFSQNLNGYKYALIEPKSYSNPKEDNWGIGAQLKAVLSEKGFILLDDLTFPKNKCEVLIFQITNSESETTSNFVTIALKDCNDKIIYTNTGSASTFTIKNDLKKATEHALVPLQIMTYSYDSTFTPGLIHKTAPINDSLSSEHKEYAILHFINVDKIWGGGIGIPYPTIQLNNTLIGRSDPSSYLKYNVFSEGKLSIIFRSDLCNTIQLQLEIKQGSDYYFQIKYKTNGYDSKKPCIVQINKNEAIQLVQNTKLKTFLELSEDVKNPLGALNVKKDKKGTGLLINSQGYVLTNYHVIEDAKKIKIKGIKGDISASFEAKVIAVDIATDLALLQVSSNLISFDSTLYFNGDINVQKGEDIYVLGYPLTESMGEEVKITKGVVNSLSGYKGDLSSLQLSAQVQPGNSGGPVFNATGKLIGIISSKLSQADDVGYAIKMSYVLNFLKQAGVGFDEPKLNKEVDILKRIDTYSKCVYIIESYTE